MEKELLLQLIKADSVSIPHLLFTHYSHIGLTEKELVLLIKIHHFIKQGNKLPSTDELSEGTSMNASECASLLRDLHKREYFSIKRSGPTKYYCFERLWEKLRCLIEGEEISVGGAKNSEKEMEEMNLFSMFEKEFARPLSPFEMESLNIWIDQDDHNPDLIKTALREAVMSGRLNFRYIDRILFDWKRNGINTAEAAREYSKAFRGRPTNKEEKPVVAIPNWLDE